MAKTNYALNGIANLFWRLLYVFFLKILNFGVFVKMLSKWISSHQSQVRGGLSAQKHVTHNPVTCFKEYVECAGPTPGTCSPVVVIDFMFIVICFTFFSID